MDFAGWLPFDDQHPFPILDASVIDASQQVIIIITGQFVSEGYFHRNLSSPTIKIDHNFDLCCFAASDSFVLRRFSSAAVSLKTIPDIREGRKVFLFTF